MGSGHSRLVERSGSNSLAKDSRGLNALTCRGGTEAILFVGSGG